MWSMHCVLLKLVDIHTTLDNLIFHAQAQLSNPPDIPSASPDEILEVPLYLH